MDELVALAGRGDAVALDIFAQAGEELGRSIANLINILSPEEVIISGEGMRAADFLVGALNESDGAKADRIAPFICAILARPLH